MDFVRTPDERFENLPDFPFEPNYMEVDGLRLHYLDEGDPSAPPVLLMHGEPSWCYLYRKMIPGIVAAGYRAIAPDLIGFGRSDKPTSRDAYTYASHMHWMTTWLKAMDLKDITLFCQDWGGLLGLRLVAENPDLFARVVAGNTFLPTGTEGGMPQAFMDWRNFSQEAKRLPVGRIIKGGCYHEISKEVYRAYEAPFPDETYKAGARKFPVLVPISPDDPAREDNERAWEVLKKWDKPFLLTWGMADPVMAGADLIFRRRVPGTKKQPHVRMDDASHFLQEDKGEELARIVVEFIKANS